MKNPKYTTHETYTEVFLEDSTCLISNLDAYLLEIFPNWNQSGVGKGIRVSRRVPTEFGFAREEYSLHRLITKAPSATEVDHKNRDPKDNRRENLRFCNRVQNTANRRVTHGKSGFMGVFKTSRKLEKCWMAYAGGKPRRNLGYYLTPEEAARARDRAVIELYGEFACLNFPDG